MAGISRTKAYLNKFVVVWTMLELIFYKAIGALLFIGFCFTSYYWIPLLYAVWVFYNRNICYRGGSPSKWFKTLSRWEYCRDYFPMHLIKTADINPNRNYIFACYPHGVAALSHALNFGTEANSVSKLFPNIKVTIVTLTNHLFTPIVREHLLAIGIVSCAAKSIQYLLCKQGKGNAVVITPGGAAEMIHAHRYSSTLILKNRKGFVKMAVRYGAALVPVYSFGETSIFDLYRPAEGSLLQKIVALHKYIFGYEPPMAYGEGLFCKFLPILPFQEPVYTIVGAPIDVEQMDNPTEEMIDKYHSIYIDKLKQLFEEYKQKLGERFKDQELILK